MFDGLPIEVGLLFGTLIFVGIAGLIKSSGGLSGLAPTVGLGESRDDNMEEASAAQTEMEKMEELSQGEKEKKYFAVLAEEQSQKRGGSKSKRKKSKK